MGFRVEHLDTDVVRSSIQMITAMETTKMISWLKPIPLSANTMTKPPNARPPPRMRQSVGRRSLVSSRTSRAPEIDTRGTIRPHRNTVE